MLFPVVNMKQTGRNITMLREQRGISVKQLQRMMGFATPQAIYKWQHGESLPTVDNLVALSVIFSVPIDAILVTGNAA
ncbi:MAG: helix-turn-helix transcriptional regulator [Clostridiales bacterium]|nr:helix-turn-helix transcriptional regulator [Clostridiales bacterium]